MLAEMLGIWRLSGSTGDHDPEPKKPDTLKVGNLVWFFNQWK